MRSRKRPGVNPRSSATAAASEAMKSAVRTVSLRRRWRAQWRAPLGVSLQRTQALVPVGSFHGFFYFCKAFAGSGEIGDAVSHPFYT